MEKVQGGNQKFIALGDLRGLPLVIPSFIDQERFGSVVEQSDKSKFELKESIKKMDGLIKSLIQNENW
jgi:hypothetical protein